jgi:hypothetical protein
MNRPIFSHRTLFPSGGYFSGCWLFASCSYYKPFSSQHSGLRGQVGVPGGHSDALVTGKDLDLFNRHSSQRCPCKGNDIGLVRIGDCRRWHTRHSANETIVAGSTGRSSGRGSNGLAGEGATAAESDVRKDEIFCVMLNNPIEPVGSNASIAVRTTHA